MIIVNCRTGNRLHVGWAINRIPHYPSDSCAWLGIGRLTVGLKNNNIINENLFSTIDSYMQVDKTHVRSRRAYVCDHASTHMHTRLHKTCVIFIAYSISCNSVDCVSYKNSQFVIKRISHSIPNPYSYIHN